MLENFEISVSVYVLSARLDESDDYLHLLRKSF